MSMTLVCARPFSETRLATFDDALDPARFAAVLREVEQLVTTERSYLPAHKKGGTVAYSTLRERAPLVTSLYQGTTIRAIAEAVTGLSLEPTPLHDESSCSILFYEKPGDHIGWHYDHNFYRGRHFTLLVPMVNRGKDGGRSAARLLARIGGEEIEVATPPNRLILFEGASVHHKVTPIAAGERRIVWSMTYCTDPRSHVMQGLARRVKDTAFFGVRALWS